jgi:hypothetical protein
MLAIDALQQIQYEHYSKFVRSKKNLRQVVEREELKDLIKADGGVKIPGYVYGESKNLQDPLTGESLMVIYDMNCRHWCLEQLANDEEYLKSGGSLLMPYLVLPDEIADDPLRERMFMISLGISNKNFSAKEVGRGYLDGRRLKLAQLKEQHEGWNELSEKEQASLEKKFKTQIINQIMEDRNLTLNEVYKIFRVFDFADQNEFLNDALETELITLSSADELIKVAKKIESEPKELLSIAQKVAFDRAKDRVSDIDIAQAARIIKHPEIKKFVEAGSIPTQYVEEVLKTAEEVKTDIAEIVSLSQEFGGVNPASLKEVLNCMSESDTSATDPLPEAFQESEESEELEKYLETENEELEEKISKKEIAEAKDSIMAFAEELFEMVNNKFIGISPMTLVSTADRLLKIQTYLTKNSK